MLYTININLYFGCKKKTLMYIFAYKSIIYNIYRIESVLLLVDIITLCHIFF